MYFIGLSYLAATLAFHIYFYFIIYDISSHYDSGEKCNNISSNNIEKLLFSYNTIFLIFNMYYVRACYNVCKYINYEQYMNNAKANYNDIVNNLSKIKDKVGFSLCLILITFAITILFNILLPLILFKECYIQKFTNDFHKIIFMHIIWFSSYFLNNCLYYYFFFENVIEKNFDIYFVLGKYYEKQNKNIIKTITFIFTISLCASLYIYEHNKNTWINIIFWFGIVFSLLHGFAINNYKEARFEILQTMVLYIICQIMSLTMLLIENKKVSSTNILALCLSNSFFLITFFIKLLKFILIPVIYIFLNIIYAILCFTNILFGIPASTTEYSDWIDRIMNGKTNENSNEMTTTQQV